MARFLLSQGTIQGSNFVINLSSGVGKNRTGSKEDTMLVQFFLEATRAKWRGQKPVARDGYVGRFTIEAIEALQTHILGKFNIPGLQRDGAVDPMPTFGSGVLYTLNWLHHEYIFDAGKAWPELRNHPAWNGPMAGILW